MTILATLIDNSTGTPRWIKDNGEAITIIPEGSSILLGGIEDASQEVVDLILSMLAKTSVATIYLSFKVRQRGILVEKLVVKG